MFSPTVHQAHQLHFCTTELLEVALAGTDVVTWACSSTHPWSTAAATAVTPRGEEEGVPAAATHPRSTAAPRKGEEEEEKVPTKAPHPWCVSAAAWKKEEDDLLAAATDPPRSGPCQCRGPGVDGLLGTLAAVWEKEFGVSSSDMEKLRGLHQQLKAVENPQPTPNIPMKQVSYRNR